MADESRASTGKVSRHNAQSFTPKSNDLFVPSLGQTDRYISLGVKTEHWKQKRCFTVRAVFTGGNPTYHTTTHKEGEKRIQKVK